MYKIVSEKSPKQASIFTRVGFHLKSMFPSSKNGSVCKDADNNKIEIDRNIFNNIISNPEVYSNFIGQLQNERLNKIHEFVKTLKNDYKWQGDYAFVVCGSLVNNRVCITSDIDYFFILRGKGDGDNVDLIEKQLSETFEKDCPANNLFPFDANHKAHYILVKDLPKYYKENELFRNSLSTGLMFPSRQNMKNEIDSISKGLWDELISKNTVDKLLEISLKKLTELDLNLYSSKKLPAMIKPLIIAKMLLKFKLTDEEFQKTRQIQDMLFRIRDCAYFENNQQHIKFTNKSLPHYEKALGLEDLYELIIESRAYIISLLEKYKVM